MRNQIQSPARHNNLHTEVKIRSARGFFPPMNSFITGAAVLLMATVMSCTSPFDEDFNTRPIALKENTGQMPTDSVGAGNEVVEQDIVFSNSAQEEVVEQDIVF